jgi:UDP-glucose 4-epimerase
VRDAAEVLVQLLDRPEKTAGEIYNTGSDEEVTIKQLAITLIERTGTTSTVNYIPYCEAFAPGFQDMRLRVPDTTKLYKTIGWKATRNLTQILDDVVRYEQLHPALT